MQISVRFLHPLLEGIHKGYIRAKQLLPHHHLLISGAIQIRHSDSKSTRVIDPENKLQTCFKPYKSVDDFRNKTTTHLIIDYLMI